MTEKQRWKTVLQYAAGLLGLAVCVAVAIFVPEGYANWQDERLVGQVTLSDRENIEFIDADSLDLEGRLKILQEADYVGVAEELNLWTYGINEEKVEQQVWEAVKKWYDAGLLPEPPEELIREADLQYYMLSFYLVNIQAGQARLPVYIGRFALPDFENVLTVVMDQEKAILYYASVTGIYPMEHLAGELGYNSLDELKKMCQEGESWGRMSGDSELPKGEEKDYASVCGALSSRVVDQFAPLEENVELEFETFQGYACRRIIYSEYGFGEAVMYGTDLWCDVMAEMSDWYGFEESRSGLIPFYMYLIDGEDISTAELQENAYNQYVEDEKMKKEEMNMIR